MKTMPLLLILALGGCGSSTEPSGMGKVVFVLDVQICPGYASATYVVDSAEVGTEPIVPGAISKGYSAPSGKRTTIARLTNTGTSVGLWTFRDRVIVPANGTVTAHLSC